MGIRLTNYKTHTHKNDIHNDVTMELTLYIHTFQVCCVL